MNQIKITKEDLIECLNTYNTQEEIASHYHTNRDTIAKLLKKYGLPTNIKQYKINKLKEKYSKEFLYENYVLKNITLHELEEELGLPNRRLEILCQHYGIKKPYKAMFNLSKFYDLTDPNVYYLAGLIATDGYIDTDGNRVTIELVGDSEFKLLTQIKTYFETPINIKQFDKGDNYIVNNLTFSDKDIKQFYLNNFNIPSNNKTFNVRFPNNFYNEDCVKAYILGCLDGDGCITHLDKCYPDVKILSASYEFLKGFQKALKEYINIEVNVNTVKKQNSDTEYFEICVCGKCSILLLDWVYSYNGFKLERKYLKYLMAKDIV